MSGCVVWAHMCVVCLFACVREEEKKLVNMKGLCGVGYEICAVRDVCDAGCVRCEICAVRYVQCMVCRKDTDLSRCEVGLEACDDGKEAGRGRKQEGKREEKREEEGRKENVRGGRKGNGRRGGGR